MSSLTSRRILSSNPFLKETTVPLEPVPIPPESERSNGDTPGGGSSYAPGHRAKASWFLNRQSQGPATFWSEYGSLRRKTLSFQRRVEQGAGRSFHTDEPSERARSRRSGRGKDRRADETRFCDELPRCLATFADAARALGRAFAESAFRHADHSRRRSPLGRTVFLDRAFQRV